MPKKKQKTLNETPSRSRVVTNAIRIILQTEFNDKGKSFYTQFLPKIPGNRRKVYNDNNEYREELYNHWFINFIPDDVSRLLQENEKLLELGTLANPNQKLPKYKLHKGKKMNYTGYLNSDDDKCIGLFNITLEPSMARDDLLLIRTQSYQMFGLVQAANTESIDVLLWCPPERPLYTDTSFDISFCKSLSSEFWYLENLYDSRFVPKWVLTDDIPAFIPSNQKSEKDVNLNQEQQQALDISLNNESGVLLVIGPPGSGKSTLISAIVSNLRKQDIQRKQHTQRKILVCAQTNNVVDDLSKKYHDSLPEDMKNLQKDPKKVEDVSLIRLGSKGSKDFTLKGIADTIHDHITQIEKKQGVSKKYVQGELIEKVPIIFSTLASTHRIGREEKFDVVIIDEAAQCQEIVVLMAILRANEDKCMIILVGDSCQLPPYSSSQYSTIWGSSKSLFTRLLENKNNFRVQLKTQYRMTSGICSFPSQEFYGGTLESGIETTAPNFKDSIFISYDVDVQQNEKDYENKYEAKCCNRLCELLPNSKITILAYYKDQVSILQKTIQRENVLVHTIDSFQGREDDIIIVSCSRANELTGFIDDWHRVNVALTRAKKRCIVIGHRKTLETSSLWSSYINHQKEKETIYKFEDYCKLIQTEINQ